MKARVFITLILFSFLFSCEHEIGNKCRLGAFVYDSPSSEISSSEYSVYKFILLNLIYADDIYLDQGTSQGYFPSFTDIKSLYPNAEEALLSNFESNNDPDFIYPTAFLDPLEFGEIDDLCIIPTGEYNETNYVESIYPIRFSRIGLNSDSTEAILNYRSDFGSSSIYLQLVNDQWEVLWNQTTIDNSEEQ